MQLGAKHAATRGHKHVAHPAWVVRRQPECSGVSLPARLTSLNLPTGLGLCNPLAARFSGDTVVVGNPPGRTKIDSTLLYRKILFVNSRALQRTLEFIREVCERDPWACVPGRARAQSVSPTQRVQGGAALLPGNCGFRYALERYRHGSSNPPR